MSVSKVTINGETQMDLTQDTVTADNLLTGYTAHRSNGSAVTGGLGVATQSSDGLMSASDKEKLDGVAAGATANIGTITGIMMNGVSKGTSGVVDLGTVAELDANGKVPSAQLPSYVDDVLEYNGTSAFPATGETGKIYVDTTANTTYRWSGSTYVAIGSSLALGTTSSTAFRGDYGNTAYQHATAKGSAFSSGLYKITTNAEGHVTAATAVAKADITALGIPAQDTTYSAITSAQIDALFTA